MLLQHLLGLAGVPAALLLAPGAMPLLLVLLACLRGGEVVRNQAHRAGEGPVSVQPDTMRLEHVLSTVFF